MSKNGNNSSAPGDAWFVVWCESRSEKKVQERIRAKGLTTWLPTYRERHRWSDRWREVELPLFPGYVFARSSDCDWHRVLRTPGVLTVVKNQGKPAFLTDRFVESLRHALDCGSAPHPVSDPVEYEPGDEVIVQEGALCGVRGVVREQRSGRQLIVWVSEIGRGVAFSIGTSMVKAAQPV